MAPRLDAAQAEEALRAAALHLVQNEHGARVEDYLATLAAATGEAAIVAAGLFDIEDNEMTPGSGVFGDEINQRLTGDGLNVGTVPAATVVGVLRDRLVPVVAPLVAFGTLEGRYRFVADHVGHSEWGRVALSIDPDHAPWVLPIRAAFEMRRAIVAVESALADGRGGAPWARRDLLCAGALAAAIDETASVLHPAVGVPLALDVVFGMAKMVPMSQAAFARIAEEELAGE
jgi:hypothetical protein